MLRLPAIARAPALMVNVAPLFKFRESRDFVPVLVRVSFTPALSTAGEAVAVLTQSEAVTVLFANIPVTKVQESVCI